MNPERSSRGFSMIELLLVLSMIGVLAIVSAGINQRQGARWALNDVARQIRTSYYQSRSEAVSGNRYVWMQVLTGGAKYYVWDETTSNWVPLDRNLWRQPFRADDRVQLGHSDGMVISPQGMVLTPPSGEPGPGTTNPATLILAPNTRIELTSVGEAGTDKAEIQIYPFGGLKVETEYH